MFDRIKKLQLSVIKQMELRASHFPDVVSLAQGIPSFDTPGCIKRRVERALKRGVVARYSLSPGLPELRELIEADLSREEMYYDWQNEIIVTAGSIEAITAAVLAITSPGDEIIIPEPTYTSYREVIYLAGCKPIYVSLDESQNWSLNLEKLKQAITKKTKAILYCNPNNPTGTIYPKEQLQQMAELALAHDIFLISDEVYKDFIFDNTKYFTLAQESRLRKHVIRIYGFSKAYALTGWRIGYVHSDESVIKQLLKVHDSLVTCAPVISQYAAMGALEMGEADIKIFNQKYIKRRDLITERLDRLNHIFSYIKPNSAYYVFPKILEERRKSWDFALELLEKIQVAVVPGLAFGPRGENHIRMSFGRSEKHINEAFDRMDEYFKS
jgi:aminotransferase